jgi:hypothetical protein
MNYDDETLMAYVDGEVDAKVRADIDAAIANDPALARRVEQQRAVRAKVAGAFAKVLEQPLPDRLMRARAGGTGVGPRLDPAARRPWQRAAVSGASRRAACARGADASGRRWPRACCWVLSSRGGSCRRAKARRSSRARTHWWRTAALARALDAQLASEQRGEEPVLIGLTFKAHDGNYCRSFELRATRTPASRAVPAADWQCRDRLDDTAAGQMQQASSTLSPAILRAIEARVEGSALDADAERDAQLAGWKSP